MTDSTANDGDHAGCAYEAGGRPARLLTGENSPRRGVQVVVEETTGANLQLSQR
jgi:hypothetical protein